MDFLLQIIDTVAISGALLIGALQIRRASQDSRRRDVDRRTERTLELYSDLVDDGETAKAFHRLSVLLRRMGSQRFGTTTWLLLSDLDLQLGGSLDPENAEYDTAFEDLYRVLWFFERAKTSLDHGLVDSSVLFETIGFHFWWWNEILRDLHGPKAVHAIRDLGASARRWSLDRGQIENWQDRCATDFGGGPHTSVGSGSSVASLSN